MIQERINIKIELKMVIVHQDMKKVLKKWLAAVCYQVVILCQLLHSQYKLKICF
jgi:hypothetical protein